MTRRGCCSDRTVCIASTSCLPSVFRSTSWHSSPSMRRPIFRTRSGLTACRCRAAAGEISAPRQADHAAISRAGRERERAHAGTESGTHQRARTPSDSAIRSSLSRRSPIAARSTTSIDPEARKLGQDRRQCHVTQLRSELQVLCQANRRRPARDPARGHHGLAAANLLQRCTLHRIGYGAARA